MVDADDRVIDVMPRGEIHRLGLMHRSVHILVFNSANEFFIQKRSMSKDSNPGLWHSSAAGHVESGEDYRGCAQRELGEELGIFGPRSLASLFRLPASPTTGMEHCTVYRCVHDGPLTLQADEIEEGMSPENADRSMGFGACFPPPEASSSCSSLSRSDSSFFFSSVITYLLVVSSSPGFGDPALGLSLGQEGREGPRPAERKQRCAKIPPGVRFSTRGFWAHG